MPRIPWHKYLGPGNSLNEGEPVNNADRIAYYHDLAYDKRPEDVSRADEEAIEDFGLNIIENPSEALPSALGWLGLKAKRAWERHFGQVYPSVSNNNR